MIYYNSNIINDWNFGDDNIIKVYKHGAVCYYKITSGDTPTPVQEPCFAVVDDITQYSDTEFEDVFNKADGLWYKLNNLNQYEQYGIYGSGRTLCEGSSRLPQGYTEVEYIRQNSNYNAYINTGVIIFDNTTNTYTITTRLTSEFHSNLGCATIISCESLSSPYNGLGYRYKCSSTVDQLEFFGGNANYNSSVVDNGDGTRTVTFQSTGNTSYTTNVPLSFLCSFNNSSYTSAYRFADATIYSSTIVKNGITVRDFVPAKRDSDSVYGLYDLINNAFYTSPNGNNFSGGEPITPTDCVTTYNGKLTIDDGYEYEWNGSSWVNIGEVSGSSKTSDFKIGDIDNPITSDASLITDGMYGIILPVSLSANTSSAVALMGSSNSNTLSNLSSHTKTSVISENDIIDYAVWKFHGTATANTFYVENVATKKYFGYSNVSISYMPLVDESSKVPTVFSAFTYNNVTALGICKGNTPNQYYAINDLYGRHNQYNWFNLLSGAGDLNNSYVIYKLKGSEPEYPVYYDEMQDPPDNLVFSSMAEAEAYECPWVGMKATINGDKYVFSGDSQSGYEWVYNPSRLPVGYTEVEYIENTSTSYINTNFKPNQDTRILLTVQCVTSTSYGRYIGAGDYNAANAIQFDYESGAQGTLHISWGHINNWTVYSNCVGDYGEHTYDWDKNYFYRDKGETNQFSASTTYTAFQCVANLGIFCHIYNNGSAPTSQNEFLKGKLYTFKMYDNGTLIRDLVPCKRDSDDKYGMYDIVNDVFYVSPNGNNFIGGDPV